MDNQRIEKHLQSWPAGDREAFKRALVPADFDPDIDVEAIKAQPDGRAAHLRPATLIKMVECYSYWLRFLATRGELEVEAQPGVRVTPPRLGAYCKELRRVSQVTRSIYVKGLTATLTIIDPAGDHRLVQRLARLLRRTAKPCRDQRHLLVPPSDMFYAGIRRMDRALPDAQTDVDPAAEFEGGLMMAVMVCKALRRKNFAGMMIGRNITRNVLDVYEVKFDPSETKAHRRISAKLSAKLTPYLDLWFDKVRPVLLSGRSSTAMWITTSGTDMSARRFYKWFCRVTKQELDVRINPHLTRKIVATGVAIAAPELVRMTASLLDQSSDQSKAYNLADQLSASEAYLAMLEARRKEALENIPKPPVPRKRRDR